MSRQLRLLPVLSRAEGALMGSMYFLIVLTVFVGFGAWMLFLWAARNGQFDDLERPKYRMLDDDDD